MRELGDVRRAREPATPERAVEQAHDALDAGDVGGLRDEGAVEQERNDALGALHVGVEVAPDPTAGRRVVAGVDVVGADLVGAHADAPVVQGCEEAGRHHRLAAAGGRRGDDDSRQGP